MKQIHTREQLVAKLVDIIAEYGDDMYYNAMVGCAETIADLIADLPNLCFHSKDKPI